MSSPQKLRKSLALDKRLLGTVVGGGAIAVLGLFGLTHPAPVSVTGNVTADSGDETKFPRLFLAGGPRDEHGCDHDDAARRRTDGVGDDESGTGHQGRQASGYSPVNSGLRLANIAEMPSDRSLDGRNAEFHAAT